MSEAQFIAKTIRYLMGEAYKYRNECGAGSDESDEMAEVKNLLKTLEDIGYEDAVEETFGSMCKLGKEDIDE